MHQRPIDVDCALYREQAFQEVIQREVARNMRSRRPSLLVLLDASVWVSAETAQKVALELSSSTREIDVKGWYTEGATLGILFT